MATGQKLRGFVGQGMSGLRKAKSPLSYVYSPGSYTFRPTKPGWYRFVVWGAGGAGNATGAASGGGLVIADRVLSVGQSAAIVVAATGGAQSSVTFPDGSIITATSGVDGLASPGGVGSGNAQLGDITASGGASTIFGTAGAGASSGVYVGGSGGGTGPGAGIAGTSFSGSGLCIVHQTRLRP
jgi:hypothetical protein